MNILIIGQGGQVARALRESERPSHWQVTALGRDRLNITSKVQVMQTITALKPDVVINPAAYTAVDRAETERGAAFSINQDGARYVAEACEQTGAILIHLSTDYVFDGRKGAPYLETDVVSPLNVYGHSKAAGEEAVRSVCTRHFILRTSWVFSPFGHNFLLTMLRLADQRDQLQIVNDQHGCPTYAPHLAQAILSIVERLETSPSTKTDALWGTYHLAGTGSASWFDLASRIFAEHARITGASPPALTPINSEAFPTPARRPQDTRLNCDKAVARFQVRLPHWHEGVASCLKRLKGDNR